MNLSNDLKDDHQVSTDQSKFSVSPNQFLFQCVQKKILNPKIIKSVFKSMNIKNAKWDVPLQKSIKKFSEEEDKQLKSLVNYFGAKNWTTIALFMTNKTARQCRDRYKNYLAPGFIHSQWTEEEDLFLAQKYQEIGPHWSEIQKFFPYRTSNSIKNRYNYTVCKKLSLKDPLSLDYNINIGSSQQIENDLYQINNDDYFNFEYDFGNGINQDNKLREIEFNLSFDILNC